MNKVLPIPEGYHSVTPYLIVHDATQAIDFYKRVFGATEIMRMPQPDGRIAHAEIKIGDSLVMLADEFPEMDFRSAKTLRGTPISLLLYVADVDMVFKRAIDAGAKELKPLQNQFYGDRMGMVQDPFAHKWTIATHIEDVSHEEMKKRMKAMEQKA